MKNKMNGFSRLTVDDIYHDYGMDFSEQVYCEETGKLYNVKRNNGWDDYEELYEEEYRGLWEDEEELNG